MIIALHPSVLLVAHIRRIVSSVDGAHMVDHGVQGEPEVSVGILLLGHKRRHVELHRELDERGDLAVDEGRVLETFEMKRDDTGQGAKAELLGGLLVGLAGGALDLGRRS